MRKSKFAIICLYVSLATLLINILVIIVLLNKTSNFINIISWIYKPIMLLSITTFISSLVSLIRVATSKKQLKGIAKSITAMALSVVLFVAGFAQGIFAEAALSVKNLFNSEYSMVNEDYGVIEDSEQEQERADNNIPKFVKKDFDVVAVADYYGEIDKVGFIDKEGDFVIEPKFDDAKDFYEGLAPVKIDRKWGYIDKTGEFVIQPQFDRADIFSSGVAAVRVDGKWGVIDKTGTFTIQPSLENPIRFVDGLAVMKSEDTGKVGYIDITGKFVIEPVYTYAQGYFSDGYAYVSKDSDFKIQGFVDKMGIFAETPISGRAIGALFSENLVPVYKEDGRGGYIDTTWKFVIEPIFSMVDNFSEGLAAVQPQEEEKLGYIDKTGNIVIEPKFTHTDPFSEGLALVTNGSVLGGPYGYIDKLGNYVIEPKFTYAYSFSEGLALVNIEDEGWGFIDKTGKFVIGPVEYANFGKFHKVDGIFDRKKAEVSELEIK